MTSAPGGNDRAGGQRINDPAAKAPGFKRNAKGLTYGSAADAPRADLEPDLIWVVTDSGGSGYVYGRDLNAAPPASAEPGAKRMVTAYAEDGVTSVGTFTIEGAVVAG